MRAEIIRGKEESLYFVVLRSTYSPWIGLFLAPADVNRLRMQPCRATRAEDLPRFLGMKGKPAARAAPRTWLELDRRLVRALRIFAAFGCLASNRRGVNAQELEPRAYSPAPIGTNFLIPSFVHADGDASLDPSLPITGVRASIDAFDTGYERTFDLFGRSASAAVLLPYVQSVLTGQVNQQSGRTTRYGLGDTALRLQVNLLGAPAQTPAEFFQHEPSNYARDKPHDARTNRAV